MNTHIHSLYTSLKDTSVDWLDILPGDASLTHVRALTDGVGLVGRQGRGCPHGKHLVTEAQTLVFSHSQSTSTSPTAIGQDRQPAGYDKHVWCMFGACCDV